MLVGGWLRRVGKFLNPGIAGWLLILFFIILFAIIAPIALRIGKLFVEPILWLYESRNYSVGLSLTGLIIPAIVAIALAGLLHKRRHRVVPAIMANEWFWFFVIIYVVVTTALPVISPTATAVLLSLNAPMILAAPLIFITAFGLARDVEKRDYWVAAEAYIALFIPLILSDSATAIMAGVATEAVHLLTRASLVIGGYGIMDGLVLIPTEAAIAALITVVAVRHLDVLKVVFKNALVDIGLSVLLFTGVLLGLRYVPYNLAGPIFGAAITLFATGLYSVTNYLLTTTTLSHELDIECRSDDCNKGRIIIRVKNTGKNIAEDVYALVSIRAREKSTPPKEVYLGIEDELLPWLLYPENVTTKVSINPMHSRKLLVFEYERMPDGYVIRVPSEGSIDKPRARLWLDFYTKYVFHIMVYGKNVRLPLETELYITMDKLDARTSYETMRNILTSLPVYTGKILFKPLNKKILDMVLRELSNDGGITERAADLRGRIFNLASQDNIEGYLGIASGFETLWNKLKNKFGWLAVFLGLIFGVSYEYAVYLALAKKWDDLVYFIMNDGLLFSCNDDVCVMTKLLLNLVTDEEFREKFSDWPISGNIYNTLLKYYVPRHLRPALARLLLPFGYENITCEFVCGHDEEERLDRECYESCERMLNAFNGDEHAVYEIALELDSVLQRHWEYEDWVKKSSKGLAPPALISEIIDYVRSNEKPRDWGFFSRAVVELRLPTTSRLRFILILHDLLKAREEFEKGNIDGAIKFVDLAKTHAMIGIMKFESKRSKELIEETDIEPSLSFYLLFSLHPSVDISFNLARILTSAIKGSLEENKKFEILSNHALILLSLYHYHVQTNLAETWS